MKNRVCSLFFSGIKIKFDAGVKAPALGEEKPEEELWGI